MVDKPRNMKITVSQICANIFVKYLTDVAAVAVILPLTYCFMAIPQATILKFAFGKGLKFTKFYN